MRLFCISLLLILAFGCSKSTTKRSNLLDFIPKNANLIIKTSNLESFNNSISNSDFLQHLSKTTSYKNLAKKIDPLTNLNPSGDLLICFTEDENDSLQYSIITKLNKDLFITDSLPNYKEEAFNFKNKSIIKSTIGENILYSSIIDSTFFASSSRALIEDAFNDINKDFELEKIYKTSSNNKTFSVISKTNPNVKTSFFIEDSLSLNILTEYLAIDVELNQNETLFNGITKASDSSKNLINIFKNTKPQINQIQNITPSNSDGFMSFTFDDFEFLKTNLLKFNKKDSITNNTSLFNDIKEVGVIYEAEKRAIILNSIDVIATKDAILSEQTVVDTYREINIYNFSQPVLFAKLFTPLISDNNANLYCVLGDFFVFSDNFEMLQNIIANFQNKTTLGQTSYYEDVKKKLSDASSLLQITNASTLKTIINKNITAEGNNYNLKNYNTSAIQFIYDNNFAHVNGIIKKNKTRASLNSVSEELNIKLENPILNAPQFVKNHITKQKEIIVQDINNNLYLISNKGKILWKKQLQGPVLGDIEQIDIYKNGRLQLAFATPNKVYVLDRNGNDVKPFTLNFNDKITQPLAVFDYDKRKKYRLLVTQGKNVLMYDVKGKTVKGFTFKSADNNIISQPKHFRIGSKDYITLKTKNKLYILDRLGKTRVKPKQSYSYSNQPVFLYNNTFTTTSASGDLISIDPRGNVASKNLNLSENHTIETTSKTFVAQNENKLTIKNKTTELDFGDYSNPKLFYINNKIYVSTTDLQSHKVYLFDSQSKLLPNFPVYGNSEIALDNIDKDKSLEFVTKGASNAIILYQIN
ncbi:ribonuclease HII [Algibacter sp. R77976]|uniref:ribonuclease HII n=1 Tax=Algibacter sp. R77976 TaxID=3093873 RepID=UPI0037CB9E26